MKTTTTKKTLATVGAAGVAALIALSSVAHARNANYTELQGAETDIAAAIAIAQGAAPGKVMEAELESEDGQLVWEIKVIGEDNVRTKLELDAGTGEIIEQESKQKKGKGKDKGKRMKTAMDSDAIGIDQAIEIASGQTDGLVVEAELERKRGGNAVWEIEMVGADNNTTEIEIDAKSGDIL